ncbi:MAG TPA: riboflavin synthase [Acidimicrobiia bacterium]|nr:riboflavin synthase [Acidimicrobiia bacterium]
MFTGIVSEVGRVVAIDPVEGLTRLRIEGAATTADLSVGDSIAISGVCLTAVAVSPPSFEVEAMVETLRHTGLGSLQAGDAVNLERPLVASGRLDGHIVQGHVDGVGVVRSVAADGEAKRVWVDLDGGLARYVASRGSVAMDGVSLTVAAVDDDGFEVALIPHTLAVTTLGGLAPGDAVNVEVDVVAKYVERMLEARR